MSDDKTAIKVSHVSKSFVLPHERSNSIKSKLINFRKRGYEVQHALKDVSFEVKKGEFLGIVGRNGSGKSTLLKMLAGIYMPNSGTITVNGKLTPFIELGVGFNPELSGRDNVFLNGALLGFTRKEMEAMYDSIVEFAELERFMDQKLKNYSSGMQVRLAFSIAIRADTDILVLDEVLAVGDEAFQRKCFLYFAELKRKKKTVILVTHSMDSVQRFCTKAMLIKDGNVEYIGDTAQIASMYREENMDKDEVASSNEVGVSSNRNVTVDARLNNKPSDSELIFDVVVIAKENIPDAVLAISLTKDSGEIVYRWASDEKLTKNILIKHDNKMVIKLKIQNIFPNGEFSLNIGLRNKDMTKFYLSADQVLKFQVINKTNYSADVYWKPNEQVEIEQ
jgi:ABC-2 type transport system ATP-binding protein